MIAPMTKEVGRTSDRTFLCPLFIPDLRPQKSREGIFFPHFFALGIIMLPVMPVVACATCQSAYMVPGFEHFVELKIAYKLVVSPNILSPKEIRFLRLCFDITQQDVANFIQCERSYYAKCESQKSDTHRLSMDKQKILKFFYAEKLAIREFKKIYDAIKDLRDESILPLLSVDELELRRAHA